MATSNGHLENGFQRYFVVGTLLLLIVSLTIFARPFIIDILIPAILVVAVYPVHQKILKLTPFSRTVGSFISMLLIAVVVLLPFTLFAVFISQDAANAYEVVSSRINEIVVENDGNSASQILASIPFADKIQGVLDYLPFSTDDLLQTAGDILGQASTFLLGQTTNVLKHLSLFLLHVIVFMMALFYYLRDGDRLVEFLKSLVPLNKGYREELFHKLAQLSYGIIYGILGAAILQGVLVGIGFAVAGFSNAVFWGAIAALFSPVPFIGTFIVWGPAVIVLALAGKWVAALVFLGWCVLIVSSADNFIKPYLIGASSALNPMALLVVILGGVFGFGLKGLIIGPIVLTLTLSFLHIYQLEYQSILNDGVIKKPALKKPVRKRLLAKKTGKKA